MPIGANFTSNDDGLFSQNWRLEEYYYVLTSLLLREFLPPTRVARGSNCDHNQRCQMLEKGLCRMEFELFPFPLLVSYPIYIIRTCHPTAILVLG